ncbi:ChaN family lipoprotein [Marinobacter nanhaiticus D15-8W]|uniref:ChaN family lipoprotein n=1 Tax=Marinobacter nanhaiticus TaxID=1305740 RepID=UPI0002CA8442|nr:ChaN family lipoprotein [Marinobacter nanhaiticus]BES72352.1 ChaN family lipoprotein [Marinobacter nanhaiticus D15-8W]
MSFRAAIASSLSVALLSGCASVATEEQPKARTLLPLHSILNTHIIDSETGRGISVEALAERWQDVDVVVIGELHGHNGAHLLQARMQVALYQHHPSQILSLEQFNVVHQPQLDRYLGGELGEAEMIEDAEAWDNYKASYRPLVAFAADLGEPVIAANAPADMVRCVGRQGTSALEAFPPKMQALLPEDPFYSDPAYRERFFGALGGHGGNASNQLENRYKAQLLRDNTMASRIAQALKEHPGHQVLHLTGTFHSEYRSGTVAALEALAPDLQIRVLSPVVVEQANAPSFDQADLDKGDAIYLLAPLPPEYADPERMRDAIRAQFSEARDIECPQATSP